MKKYFLILIIVVSSFLTVKSQIIIPDSIAPYVSFIENQKLSSKDYILSLFDRYDIVVFCERTHDEFTQYELLADLFSDSRFYNQVGDIFMEMGGGNFDEEMNNYLLSENLSKEQSNNKALEIQRNAMWYPLWERYNYHFLLTTLYEINKPLPEQKKIKLHPTDIDVRWIEIATADDAIAKIMNNDVQEGRDSVMGNNITSYITRNDASSAKRKKYFVILNTAHATRGTYTVYNFQIKSAATYIFEKFGGRVANVLLNFENLLNLTSTSALPVARPILKGKLDAGFEFLGIDDRGFLQLLPQA